MEFVSDGDIASLVLVDVQIYLKQDAWGNTLEEK